MVSEGGRILKEKEVKEELWLEDRRQKDRDRCKVSADKYKADGQEETTQQSHFVTNKPPPPCV